MKKNPNTRCLRTSSGLHVKTEQLRCFLALTLNVGGHISSQTFSLSTCFDGGSCHVSPNSPTRVELPWPLVSFTNIYETAQWPLMPRGGGTVILKENTRNFLISRGFFPVPTVFFSSNFSVLSFSMSLLFYVIPISWTCPRKVLIRQQSSH